jgi:hypothetical protein
VPTAGARRINRRCDIPVRKGLGSLDLRPENPGKSPATLAGWFVDDPDRTMDELASRGVVFEEYDQLGIKTDGRGVFDVGRFRAAWIKDPDGNTLALTEATARGSTRGQPR